jgi:hypothetical protein
MLVEHARPLRFGTMRDREAIDSELRLLAAVRRLCREEYGVRPSMRLADAPLDERAALPGRSGTDQHSAITG